MILYPVLPPRAVPQYLLWGPDGKAVFHDHKDKLKPSPAIQPAATSCTLRFYIMDDPGLLLLEGKIHNSITLPSAMLSIYRLLRLIHANIELLTYLCPSKCILRVAQWSAYLELIKSIWN